MLFVDVRTDDAQAAGVIRRTRTELALARHIVKLEPVARRVLQHALGAQHRAVLFFVGQLVQHRLDLVLLVTVCSLYADRHEHFVRVMPVVMMVVMSAGAGFAVLVVVMMMFVLILVMVIVIMMVMMLMVVVVIIIVVMVTAAARAHAVLVVMVIMVVVVMMLVFVLVVVIIVIEVDFHRLAGFNDFQQRISGQVIPRRRHDADARMLLFHQRAALLDALRGQQLRAAENHRRARLNLVEEELAEVLHIHAALARVHNGRAAGHNEVTVAFLRALDGGEDFAQLAHAGRLNQQAVRMILRNQVINRLLEVAHQRAADAAGIEFIDDDARILHKAAVHADFAIFIFQQDDFSFATLPVSSFLMSVVLPAPRKPEIMLTLTIAVFLLFLRVWRLIPATRYYTTFVKV